MLTVFHLATSPGTVAKLRSRHQKTTVEAGRTAEWKTDAQVFPGHLGEGGSDLALLSSHSWGSGSHEGDDNADGDSSSTSDRPVPPWSFALTPRLGIWAVAGYGWGQLSA